MSATDRTETDRSLILKFLGRPEIRLGSAWMSSSVFDKAATLLTWLTVSGGYRSRSEISSLLWPSLPESRGRANLSQLLLVVSRRSEGRSPVEKNRDALRVFLPPGNDGESPVDVLRFLSDLPPPGCSILHSPARCVRCRERILSRLALYQGEFLQGEPLPDTLPFRIWVEETRKNLADRKRALERLLAGQAPPVPLTSPPKISREWRPLTILCVLVQGSTNLPADDVLDVIEPWRRNAEDLVRSRGGELATFRKPGLLAYFGYPAAREEDARMGATCALEVLESFSRFPFLGNLEIRAVVHSGPAACDLFRDIPDATGERTDEAVLLARQAPAGRTVASEMTMALLNSGFRTTIGGSGALPQGESLLLYPLYPLEPEPDVSPASQVLIGRSRERKRLLETWEKAATGERQSVWITGEPGIGKSALKNAFLRSVRRHRRPPDCIHELSCLPESRDTPWFPLRRFLRKNPDAMRTAPSGLRPEERPFPFEDICPDMSGHEEQKTTRPTPEDRRRKTEQVFFDILLGSGQTGPLLVIVEDVHWADHATLALLRKMLDRQTALPTMLLLTCRSGRLPDLLPTPAAENCLELLPLDRQQSRILVEQTVSQLPPKRLQSVLDLGDGIPLYLRELAMAGKNEDLPLDGFVPSGLQGLMASRIDLLGDLRELARTAACIGQSVPFELLTEVGVEGWDKSQIRSGIDTLLERGIVEKDAENPPAFVFHHSLLREALIASLPPQLLRKTHARIADVLRERFGEWIAREPEVLAGHLAESANYDEAIQTWIEASEKAAARGYPEHAREHLGYALRLVPEIRDPFQRDERERAILTALGHASWVTHGVGSDYVRDIYERRDAISGALEISTKTFPVVYSLWANTNARYGPLESGKFRDRLEEARQLPDLSSTDACQIEFALGEDAFWRGRLEEAGRYFEACLERRRASGSSPPSFFTLYGDDSAVQSLSSLSLVRWQQGLSRTALSLVRQASGLAREISHPGSIACALNYELFLHLFRNEPETVLEVAKRAEIWAERHGFHQWKILALLARGWAQANREGYRLAREIGAAVRDTVPGLSSVPSLIVAEAALRAGLPDEALHGIVDAREDADEKGVRLFYPEFFRLEGEARRLRTPSDGSTVKRLFTEAIGIARNAGAPMLSLKALLSFLRAFPGEAVPSPDVLDTFPRGEDCPELQQAFLLAGRPTPSRIPAST